MPAIAYTCHTNVRVLQSFPSAPRKRRNSACLSLKSSPQYTTPNSFNKSASVVKKSHILTSFLKVMNCNVGTQDLSFDLNNQIINPKIIISNQAPPANLLSIVEHPINISNELTRLFLNTFIYNYFNASNSHTMCESPPLKNFRCHLLKVFRQ